jgi:hypothetical protein
MQSTEALANAADGQPVKPLAELHVGSEQMLQVQLLMLCFWILMCGQREKQMGQ